MHPGYGRTGELRGETSSLHLPPCQGHPEPGAVTEGRLVHILLFPQPLGAPRSWPPKQSGTGAIWDETALGISVWSSLCPWCLWVLESKAGRLSPWDPPWCLASTKGALCPTDPLPLLMDLLLYTLCPPFLFLSPFCTHTLATRDVPLPSCLPHPCDRRTDG